MIVEVVAGEVREHHDVEAKPLDALLLERVRRHLHRDAPHAAVAERAQHALQLDRSGRGESAAVVRT